jgi:hypothetical protein
MPQEPAGSEQHPDYESSQPLPEELARTLRPGVRHALNHPTRRGILRELNRDTATPKTADDLWPSFPRASRSTIAYHAHVLNEYGGLSISAEPAERGAVRRSFASEVASDPEYAIALAATEHLDVSE